MNMLCPWQTCYDAIPATFAPPEPKPESGNYQITSNGYQWQIRKG